jgi:hypothetical protein
MVGGDRGLILDSELVLAPVESARRTAAKRRADHGAENLQARSDNGRAWPRARSADRETSAEDLGQERHDRGEGACVGGGGVRDAWARWACPVGEAVHRSAGHPALGARGVHLLDECSHLLGWDVRIERPVTYENLCLDLTRTGRDGGAERPCTLIMPARSTPLSAS